MANSHSLIRGIKKLSLIKKAILTIILLLIVILSIVGFTHRKLTWQNRQIILTQKADLSDMVTPLETYNQIINQDTYKYIDKEKVSAIKEFPVRTIDALDGWQNIKSIGVYSGLNSVQKDGKSTNLNGPLSYWDIYNNSVNQKLIVIQTKEALNMKGIGSMGFTNSSKVLKSFNNNDLAILTDLQKGRKELHLFHVEINGNITEITVFSTTDTKTMVSFAQKYVEFNNK